MASVLALDEFEIFKSDYSSDNVVGTKYLDALEYEDDYSHNQIDSARDEFIKMANEYLNQQGSPYYMREINENAMLCYRDTDEIVR